MSNRSVAIVTTTIFPLDFLDAYANNILRYGHQEYVTIYVIGDRKSDPDSALVAEACRKRGVNALFMSLPEQHDFLAPFSELSQIIPENSDNRRNVGFLRALVDGAELVISIDDDNFCLDDVDFVGSHLVVDSDQQLGQALGENGWFNLCSMLQGDSALPIYPRGFPYRQRSEGCAMVSGTTSGRVAVNVGLWKGDPDVDAVTRLAIAPVITGMDSPPVLLGKGVRSPVNTQNTAIRRDAMAAYYYVRMGVELQGLKLDRFGDILSGYFLQLCVDAVGDRIRVGSPLVDHRRHKHDLLLDLYSELAGIMFTEDLAVFFDEVNLAGDSYVSAYRHLSEELERFAAGRQGFIWTDETREYMAGVASYMRIWADVFKRLN